MTWPRMIGPYGPAPMKPWPVDPVVAEICAALKAMHPMTPSEVAAALQVHPVTVRRWRQLGTGPACKLVRVRGRWTYDYDRAKLGQWAHENGYLLTTQHREDPSR